MKRTQRATIGEAIRSARKAAGLTQVELRDASGVAQSSISQIESGEIEPSFTTALRLLESLGAHLSAVDAEGQALRINHVNGTTK